ncbi:hypothetical protein [Acinetobacter sp. YH12083]|uniref:hypothetical protein n=1 Tax=Acinetobacter sp. YH12083 TaxID=2601076 RepID=UPI001C554395|nr:hypothetical protein [Acinetobacter sp. YH12083]
MKIEDIRTHHIPAQDGVDPIDVFIVWYGEHRSQVTIRCWDQAWTAYWGGHWERQVKNFISSHTGVCYLVNSFARTRGAVERKWLRQIVESIRKYFLTLELPHEHQS